MLYEARQAEISDQLTRLKTAKEEGREEGKLEMVKNLLLMGLDIKSISKTSGLEISEIEKLKN